MPRVSVILSVYNAEKHLKQAIESILYQTFSDFEFFIVNDASTDSTASIISSFKDSRIIRIDNTKNSGVAVSANRCFDAAKGEYIARMDADDISMPKRFERQVMYMDNHTDVGICGSWIKTFGTKKNYIHRYPAEHEEIKFMMFKDNPFAQPAIMLRKSMFDKYSLRYKQECFPSEDYELWERGISFFKGANIPEVLLHYRMHTQNASSTKPEKQMKEADEVRVRQLNRLLDPVTPEQARLFLQLMRKEGSGGREFIDRSYQLLLAIKKAVTDKKEYKTGRINNFIDSCWSYACKIDFSYGIGIYPIGLKQFGIKGGNILAVRQLLRAFKYRIANKNK